MSHQPRSQRNCKEVWQGWHAIGAPMRDRYVRFVELSNQGAREIGFKDTGAMWRSGYDMPPEEFSAEIERLWQQVSPLYLSLHTFVRGAGRRNTARRGSARRSHSRDLLGNPWAQEWGNVYPTCSACPGNSGSLRFERVAEGENLEPRAW